MYPSGGGDQECHFGQREQQNQSLKSGKWKTIHPACLQLWHYNILCKLPQNLKLKTNDIYLLMTQLAIWAGLSKLVPLVSSKVTQVVVVMEIDWGWIVQDGLYCLHFLSDLRQWIWAL